MADLSLTPVATQIRPPATMSIADMLNIAQGAQALQQAQAMNPLQLEAQRLAVQQAAAVNPELLRQQQVATRVAEQTEAPRIAQQAAQTGTAQTQEQAAQFALQGQKRQAALNVAGAYAVDPRIASGKPDALDALAEMQEAMEKAGLTRKEALYQVTPWVAMMATNPGNLATSLQNAVRQGVGTAGQLPLQTGALTTVGGQPATFTPGTATISPVQLPPTGGPGMAAPQSTMPGAATPAAQTAGGYMLQYPVRQAGMPYAPGPSEAADLDAGVKYRTGLMSIQPQLIPARRNVEEVIRKAGELAEGQIIKGGGFLADTERKLRNFYDSSQYKELSKDIANVQISMMQASGGSLATDEGKKLIAYANGDATYPPNVLINIARRTQADLTNQDLQAQAAQKFASRFGDNNMKAFQTEWARNADSKIFEVMNLAQNVTDPKQRKEAVDKLLGTDPARRKEFFDKYQRIQRMVQTGALE